MSAPDVPVTWVPREPPLAPAGVAARGLAAKELVRHVLARDDAALTALRGVASPDLVLLLGPEEALPWVDGAVYVGRDPASPSLLLPTVYAPSVPVPLLERALRARFQSLAPPLVVLPTLGAVLSAAEALPLDRSRLQQFR